MLKKPLYHGIIQSCEQAWNLVFGLRSLSLLNIASKAPEFLVCLTCPGNPGETMITVFLKSRINFLVSKDIPDPLFDKHIGLIFSTHFHFKAIAYIFFQISYFWPRLLSLILCYSSNFSVLFYYHYILDIFKSNKFLKGRFLCEIVIS